MFFGVGLDGTIWAFQSMHILTPSRSCPPLAYPSLSPVPPSSPLLSHKSCSVVRMECICSCGEGWQWVQMRWWVTEAVVILSNITPEGEGAIKGFQTV